VVTVRVMGEPLGCRLACCWVGGIGSRVKEAKSHVKTLASAEGLMMVVASEDNNVRGSSA
jgi:hypothetical protein